MFKMGGAAEGITSGLDRKPLADGTDPYDRALKTSDRYMSDMEKFRGERSPMLPGAGPNFLTSFGVMYANRCGWPLIFLVLVIPAMTTSLCYRDPSNRRWLPLQLFLSCQHQLFRHQAFAPAC